MTQPGVAEFVERLRAFPCCAAVKSADQLDAALDGRAGAVFILRGNGLELATQVRRVHAAGKVAAVHLDLIDGLTSDVAGVRWLIRCHADAIISSHGQAVRAVKAGHRVAIQRLLCVSRAAVDHGLAAIGRAEPDIVELLPGAILPSVADLVLPRITVPLLAGGFIRDASDVRRALQSGAMAVTTSERALWRAA